MKEPEKIKIISKPWLMTLKDAALCIKSVTGPTPLFFSYFREYPTLAIVFKYHEIRNNEEGIVDRILICFKFDKCYWVYLGDYTSYHMLTYFEYSHVIEFVKGKNLGYNAFIKAFNNKNEHLNHRGDNYKIINELI